MGVECLARGGGQDAWIQSQTEAELLISETAEAAAAGVSAGHRRPAS